MKRLSKLFLSIFVLSLGLVGAYSRADATGMTITLTPGWNVVSTPALLSNISFSNGGNGISFSYLESGQWMSVVPTIDTMKPLWGFLVKNSNNTDVDMVLTYKNISPSESMHQKNVNIGRNLLGITTMNQPFYSINPRLYLDFTNNNNSNLLNTINTDYIAGNGNIPYPEIGEAYGIFLSSNQLYGGSNNKYGNEKNLFNTDDYQKVIGVTPGSYNIPLLKGTITTDQSMSFKNVGFYIEISGANAYEDIRGYEAGGIIYDIVVKIGSCESHIDKYNFVVQTDALGYKKIEIPLFENCNYVNAGTYDISVLLGINGEYATNFKTGMTITMNPINRYSFNNSILDGEIKPSIIEVSHNNLPNLIVETSNNQTGVQISSGMTNFVLWSGILHTTESGLTANILLDFDTVNNNTLRYKMNVSTYINGELIDTTGYRNISIKHEIPLNQNEDTFVEFRGNFTSTFTGSFVPRIIVNRIMKNNINFITQNCNYYRNECKEFNGGNYIINGGLFNVNGGNNGGGGNGGGSNNGGCSAEQLLACIAADDFDACIAHCSYNENLDVYSLITGTLFIAPGTENVELFKAKLISTNANGIEITDYEIDATNFNSGLFSNLKVYVDGVQYDWDMNSSNLVFNNNDSFDIPAGSLVYVKIVGDIADNVVTNNPVRFKLILNTGYDTITNSYINFYGQSTHGPDVSIIYPYFTLKNENTINNHYSIIPGNESTVRNFNIHQYIEDTNLSHISFYYSGTTGLSTMISSACLESEGYSISCINDELPDINTGYLMFNDFNILVQKDALLNLSLELIAEDEFSNIGNILEFTLHTGNINLQGSLGSGGSIQSEQIRIVGEVPEITLTKDGEDILMTIQNISKYGLEIGEIKYRILCNIGNSSQDCVEGTAVILDSINGIEVGTSGNFPGRITSQIGQGYGLIESNDNLTYNIHLNSNYTMESDYYTVDISSLKYRYLNDNNITDWIEVQYNVSL